MHFLVQALKAMSHNYPSIMFSCWEKVSIIVYGLLRSPEVLTRPRKGHMENTGGLIGEKLITAAIKVKYPYPSFISSCCGKVNFYNLFCVRCFCLRSKVR